MLISVNSNTWFFLNVCGHDDVYNNVQRCQNNSVLYVKKKTKPFKRILTSVLSWLHSRNMICWFFFIFLCYWCNSTRIFRTKGTKDWIRINYAILISYRCNKLDENCRACDIHCSTLFILNHHFVEIKKLRRYSNIQNDDSYV